MDLETFCEIHTQTRELLVDTLLPPWGSSKLPETCCALLLKEFGGIAWLDINGMVDFKWLGNALKSQTLSSSLLFDLGMVAPCASLLQRQCIYVYTV